MDLVAIISTIFLSILFILTLIFLYYWFVNKRIDQKNPRKVTSIVRFDLNTRKYLYFNSLFNQDKIFKETITGKWTKLSSVTNLFDSEIKKKFSVTMARLEKGSESEQIKFEINEYHKKNLITEFTFSFYKIEGETDYIAVIDYILKHPKNHHPKLKEAQKISIEEISGSQFKTKGFVAFNVIGNQENNALRLVKIISSLFSNKKTKYLYHEGILMFIFISNNKKRVNKEVEKMIDAIKYFGLSRGIKQLYKGSSVIISNKINSSKAFNQTMQTINFLISESILNNKMFSRLDLERDRDKFSSYLEAYKMFSDCIKTKTVEHKTTRVVSYKKSRKIVDYVYPSIKNVNSKLLFSIIRNKRNQKLLVNTLANSIAVNNYMSKPVMVDVYDSWIKENVKRIEYLKALYVIHFESYNLDEINKLTIELKNKGIPFAIHIKDFNSTMSTIVQTMKPKYIVIDRDVWNENNLLSSDMLIKLISLNALAQRNKIKLIYQDPSNILDDESAEQIGLEYYYQKQ